MTRAVLSLGSNLGDRDAYLDGALDRLAPWLVAVSSRVETAPWGGVEQDDFLNLVAVVDDPDADARDWLERAWACERAAERVRVVRWGPRSLDVDVLTVRDADGRDVLSDDPELVLPHPRAHERAFVLVPWAEVEPGAVVPGRGAVAALRDALPAAERAGVRPVAGGGAGGR
jgi:2-amino-4-hydroxy-6-hydroxymethyldihydropteridine diphosphokinase